MATGIDVIGIFPKKDRKRKLSKPLDAATLKDMAARGLDKAGMAAEYGVHVTHFRRLIQDRVSLNNAIAEGNKIYKEQNK